MRPALRDGAILVGAFVGVTLIAELLGAANLGTALTFGVIAFMATVVGLILLRRDERVGPGAPAARPAAEPARKAPPPPPRKRGRGR